MFKSIINLYLPYRISTKYHEGKHGKFCVENLINRSDWKYKVDCVVSCPAELCTDWIQQSSIVLPSPFTQRNTDYIEMYSMVGGNKTKKTNTTQP